VPTALATASPDTESSLQYEPCVSVQGFLRSEAFISLIVGPVGSTKTTAGLFKIIYHASRMAACRDGVRRSRAVWVRNTNEQLRDTSIPDFLKWFPDGVAGAYLKTGTRFILKFDDVECEVLFRGLDDANDVRRLLSLQASFAVFDEFREIHKDIYDAMQGRLGRYPDKMMVPHRAAWGRDSKGHPVAGCVTDAGEQNKHLWGMSNPPDMDTFWEQLLTDPPANAAVFMQPSGLDPAADWLEFLPSDYYANLMEGKTEDWIDVYIKALFGKSLAGQPVHRSFRADFHVAKGPLKPIHARDNLSLAADSKYPLLIGVDFGLTPAAVIGQMDPRGRLLGHRALTSEGMGSLRFIRERLKPVLANEFAGIPVLVIGDPAGVQRAQTDERSVFDIFKQEGFRIIPGKTNAIPGRLAAVDNWLSRQIDGGAAVLLDPVGCKPLIHALRGGYRYKISTKGEVDEKPEKNAASHVSDAFQYLCMHADPGSLGGGMFMAAKREVKKVAYVY
jgi:hypothetical protein